MDVQELMDELEAKTGIKVTPEDFEQMARIMGSVVDTYGPWKSVTPIVC